MSNSAVLEIGSEAKTIESSRRSKRNLLSREPKYVTGMSFYPRRGYRQFMVDKDAKPIQISPCAEQGLMEIGEIDQKKVGIINPILVDIPDIMDFEYSKTLIDVSAAKHNFWHDMPRASIFEYALSACERHLDTLNEGDVVIMMMKPFSYQGCPNVIAMKRTRVYTGFNLYCHKLFQSLKGNEKVLFHRERL